MKEDSNFAKGIVHTKESCVARSSLLDILFDTLTSCAASAAITVLLWLGPYTLEYICWLRRSRHPHTVSASPSAVTVPGWRSCGDCGCSSHLLARLLN